MSIERSWGLCLLTIIAMVVGVHEARAQLYPGSAPAMAGYPGVAAQMQPPMASPAGVPVFAPQYAPPAQAGPGVPMFATQAAAPYPQAGMPQGPVAAPMMPPGGMMRDMRVPAHGPMMPQGPVGAPMMPPGGMMRDMRVPAHGPMMPPTAPYGFRPATYYNPAQGAPPQQLAPSPAMPMDQGAMGGYSMTENEPCVYCEGAGCNLCTCDDLDMQILRWLLPYGAGGCAAQRWYDASAEWVTLKRDQVGDDVVFATRGIDGTPVLGTDQLTFSNESGLRASFAIQLGAGNSLETTYLGLFNWHSFSEVSSDTNDLFSIYSDYGTNPEPFGFAETDQASFQSISYSSGFDTIELNYRRRWVAPNARVQGSWLGGVRYMFMKEDFQYLTISELNNAGQNTLVSTMNSLTGAQMGGDLWICIIPGLRFGGEAKVGLYGNRSTQRTFVDTFDDAALEYEEKITQDGAAFLGDANVTLLWRINQHWTFRTGYMFLCVAEVALATDNFNPDAPLIGATEPRHPTIMNNSSVLYHGYTAGFEYLW